MSNEKPVTVSQIYDAREYSLMRARAGYHRYDDEKDAEFKRRNARWKEHAEKLALLADQLLRVSEIQGITEFDDDWRLGR